MVCFLDPRSVALPDGALIAKAEANMATVSALKKVELNLVVLPSEAFHTLQDSVITELRAWEQCALNVINEQKVNNAQTFTKNTSTINTFKKILAKNECTATMVTEAWKTIPKLHIPKEASMDAKIWKLVAGMHDARIELAKV